MDDSSSEQKMDEMSLEHHVLSALKVLQGHVGKMQETEEAPVRQRWNNLNNNKDNTAIGSNMSCVVIHEYKMTLRHIYISLTRHLA